MVVVRLLSAPLCHHVEISNLLLDKYSTTVHHACLPYVYDSMKSCQVRVSMSSIVDSRSHYQRHELSLLYQFSLEIRLTHTADM